MIMNIGFCEDLTHEFISDKRKLADQEIIDAVVAFPNTDGGELYLGVEDDGEITGLHPGHMDMPHLTVFISKNTVPTVLLRCEALDLEAPVLNISVPRRTGVTASSYEKIQRRHIKADGTPENVPMYPYARKRSSDAVVRLPGFLHSIDQPNQLFGGVGKCDVITLSLCPFFSLVGLEA